MFGKDKKEPDLVL